MDATAALSELVDVSTQVVEAVVSDADGAVEASRTVDEARAEAIAAVGAALLAEAASIRGGQPIERVHVDLDRGSLVAVTDGEWTVVATTVAEPTAGLLAYDLRAALGRMRGEGR
jgi:predicted regulator of Ras-like GTPase activity (Roadblock/LC7/MglB family)